MVIHLIRNLLFLKSPNLESLRDEIDKIDSQVVDLLNRRFVPYYYDMDSLGELYDDEATKLAMQLYPDLRYLSSMPTPPLLFMTPEKKFLGYASNAECPCAIRLVQVRATRCQQA